MQLDQMRSYLKALVVLVALVAGFPVAAWAHAGHEHGAQPSSAQAVSPRVVPVKQATDNHHSLESGQLTAERFVVSITLPSSGQWIAHAAKSVGGSEVDRVGSHPDATPANEPVEPADQGTCCCGSVACHAGMDASTLTLTDPWTLAAKVELPPVLALAGAVPGGIERPPRGSIPL
jgi:hypothetical protein